MVRVFTHDRGLFSPSMDDATTLLNSVFTRIRAGLPAVLDGRFYREGIVDSSPATMRNVLVGTP